MTKESRFLILSIFTGILFLLLRHGLQILDPTDLSWLRGDSQFYHMAFAFFKQDSWQWPPGVFKNLSFPIGTSIGATDSIPLLAFIFKGLRSFLPIDFHYFGWWQILCLGLQGYWGFKILEERLNSPAKSYLGSIFFTLTPVLLSWRFIHGGLCAHFLLLWSFSFYFPLKEKKYSHLPFKSFLIIHLLASLIQPYFLPMIFAIFALYLWLKRDQINVLTGMIQLGSLLGISLIGLFIAGHLQHGSAQDPWGFGYYNTDLSSLFNPMNSSLIIPELPLRDGQHEGFSYLGLGAIFLLGFSLTQYSKKEIKETYLTHKLFFLLLAAFFLYSFGSTFSLFGWKFLSISKLYWLIGPLKNIFRSSGRFIWPVYYTLIFLSVFLSLKSFEKTKGKRIFLFALCLQLIDLSPLFFRGEKLIPFAMIARFQEPFKTNKIKIDTKDIKITSLFPRRYGDKDCEKGKALTEQQERDFFWFSYENNLKTAALMGAGRSPKELINKQCQSEWKTLEKNGPKPHVLYVFSDTHPNNQNFEELYECRDFHGLSWCSRR